jgi:hypothetical protein
LWWKENRLSIFKPSTQEAMGSHLEKYLIPRFGSLPLAAIDERRVQEFIADMTRMKYTWPNGVDRKLSPKTICNLVGVLKQILGRKVWRDWNLTPEVPVKEQQYFTDQEMLKIVSAAEGQWRVLFEPTLVEMLKKHLGTRNSGLVFQTRIGTPFCKSNVRRKLNQILKMLKLKPAGLHAFRHGRVSVLQANGVPGDLVKEWVGHSNLRTTSRYTHFRDDYRKQIRKRNGALHRLAWRKNCQLVSMVSILWKTPARSAPHNL